MADLPSIFTGPAYAAYEVHLLNEVKKGGPVPRHVAVIMDGNRRFAKNLGLPPIEGHRKGREKLEEMLEWGIELGIKVMTVYAFSTENFERDETEVSTLMGLFADSFRRAAVDRMVIDNRIRVRVIGDRSVLPKEVVAAIEFCEEATKDHDLFTYNLAIAYGSRQEIIEAIKNIAKDVQSGHVAIDDIDEKMVGDYLYTREIPDPDLVLRTSGEQRISNFLLWQLAYAELYFTDVYWPGFRKIDFLRAVRDYQSRHRRYGV